VAQGAGLILVHAGIILMFLGELFTATFAEESMMRIDEKQTPKYSTSFREIELAIVETEADGIETVKPIPLTRFEDDAFFKMNGFELRVIRS